MRWSSLLLASTTLLSLAQGNMNLEPNKKAVGHENALNQLVAQKKQAKAESNNEFDYEGDEGIYIDKDGSVVGTEVEEDYITEEAFKEATQYQTRSVGTPRNFISDWKITVNSFDVGYGGGSRKTTSKETDPITASYKISILGTVNPGEQIELRPVFKYRNQETGKSGTTLFAPLDGAKFDVKLSDGTVIGTFDKDTLTFNDNVRGKTGISFTLKTESPRANWVSSPTKSPNIERATVHLYLNGKSSGKSSSVELYGRPRPNNTYENGQRGTTRFLKYDEVRRRVHFTTGVTFYSMSDSFMAKQAKTPSRLKDMGGVKFTFSNVNNGTVRVENRQMILAAGDEFASKYEGTKNIFSIGEFEPSSSYVETLYDNIVSTTGKTGGKTVSFTPKFLNSKNAKVYRVTALLEVSVPISSLTDQGNLVHSFGSRNAIHWEISRGDKEKITYHNSSGKYVGVDKFEQSHSTVSIPEGVAQAIARDLKYTRDTLVEKDKIPYETIERKNPNLPAGERKVVQTGIVGEVERTYDVWKNKTTGSIVTKELKSTRVIKTKRDEIIEIGTKVPDDVMEKREEVEKKKIPYDTIYEFNPSLKEGEEKVIQKGKEGEIVITYDITYNVTKQRVEKKEERDRKETPKVDEIIQTGTILNTDDFSPIPFKTKYQANDNENVGYEKTLKEGAEGEKAKVGAQYKADGTKVKDGKWTTIKEPVDKLIEKGTKEVDGTEIPFKTYYQLNKELSKEELKLIQKGVTGTDGTIKFYGVDENTGELTKEPVRQESQKKEKVDEIYEFGVGHPFDDIQGIDQKDYRRPIPYETKYKFNPDKPFGYKEVIQEGVEGYELRFVKYLIKNGNMAEPVSKEWGNWEVIENKVDEIIEYGTHLQEDNELPFRKIRIIDPTLKDGEEIVEQEGKVGVETITHEVEIDPETGKEISRKEVDRKRQEPVDEIIRVGLDSPVAEESLKDKDKQQEEELPFETIERENPDLPEGERRVVQEGVPGKQVRIVTVVVDDEGKIVETLDLGEWKVIQEPVNEIIEIGTKKEKPAEKPAKVVRVPKEKQKKVEKPKADGKLKPTGLVAISGGFISLLSGIGAWVGYKKRNK